MRRNRPAISGAFEWALRVHLAAFYFDGRYANLAMRAVGARLAYTRAKDEPRSRYAVLGVFTLVQAVGEAASAGAEATAGWRATVAAAARARSDRLPRHPETNRGMGEGDAPEEKSVRGAVRRIDSGCFVLRARGRSSSKGRRCDSPATANRVLLY